MSLSLMPNKEQGEITDLLANWGDTRASGLCFHCYQFAAGASDGVPCDGCKDNVQHEAEVQAWRDKEAATEARGRDSGYSGVGRSGWEGWD